MKKILSLSVFLLTVCLVYGQGKPTAWITKSKAKEAKAYIKKAKMITYYKCATAEIAYSIEKPKVKIKKSTLGAPYYDVFVIGRDQSGEKRTRKIMLDEIWVKETNGTYTNMADALNVKREECSVPELNEYFAPKD